MGRRSAERFTEDDYFAEPNYDQFSDEELDELYNYGEIRSSPALKEQAIKSNTAIAEDHAELDLEQDLLEIDIDFDDGFDPYDDE